MNLELEEVQKMLQRVRQMIVDEAPREQMLTLVDNGIELVKNLLDMYNFTDEEGPDDDHSEK